MTWEGRVSFALTDTLQIKKLSFVDGVRQDDASASKADRFDADVVTTYHPRTAQADTGAD